MHDRWKRCVVGALCLVALLLASGPPLTSYAAARIAHLPQSPGACTPKVPADTGTSPGGFSAQGAADYVYTDWSTGTPVGMFSYYESSLSPTIGGLVCQSGDLLLLLDFDQIVSTFKLTFFSPGFIAFPPFTYDGGGRYTIELGPSITSFGKRFIVAAQACFPDTSTCDPSSPALLLVAASNSYCQDGYVWRQAAPFDLVCVQPWEVAQAAYDNSQTATRGNSYPDLPQACNPGYVWRLAWAGDYVCVDPPQRQQVINDNSQEFNRIVQL